MIALDTRAAELVAAVVAAAPPMTAEQAERLRKLLPPASRREGVADATS